MMNDAIQNLYEMNRAYARRLIDDVDQKHMGDQPSQGMNHPAWVLGHLTVVEYRGLGLLGVDEPTPDGWDDLFGARTTPSPDVSIYPPKQTLVNAYEHIHERINKAYANVDPAQLDAPNTRVRPDQLPTQRALLSHMMTTHEAIHLGQLSAWRRVKGLASV